MKIVLLFSVVTFILNYVNAVSRPANFDDRTYVFAINLGLTVRAVGPKIEGVVSIISKVCQMAHKKCEFVSGSFQRCVDGLVSEVLDTREADACGFGRPTAVRKLGYKFDDLGIIQTSKAAVIVRKKSTLTLKDLQNPKLKLKIALLDFFRSPKLALQCYFNLGFFANGGVIKVNSSSSFDLGMRQIIKKVEDGEVDMGLILSIYLDKDDSVRILKKFTDDECPSIVDVVGIMTRKDDSLLDWFNPAYLKLVCSDYYEKLCDSLMKRLGLQESFCIQVDPSKCLHRKNLGV